MLARRIPAVVVVLDAELTALVVLHGLGSYGSMALDWHDLAGWLAASSPEDTVVAVARLLALVLAWWLAASTVLYLLARMAHQRGLVRAVGWATLPPVRRFIDGVATATVVATSVVRGPRMANAAPGNAPVVVSLDAEASSTTSAPSYRPRAAGPVGSTSPAPAAKATIDRPQADPDGDSDTEPPTTPAPMGTEAPKLEGYV